MHSGQVCAPCSAWKASEKPKWEKAGWSVEVITETTTDRGWPWFEIYENGSLYIVDGPLTADKFEAAKKK